MTYDEAADLFDRRRNAWLGEDVEAYLAMWAEDMTFQSPLHQPPLRGREAFARLVRQSMAIMKPEAFDVRHLAVRGRTLLAEWRIAAVHRDSGQHVEWEGMSVADIEDGRIKRWREYWNPADLAPR
jgi:limonene-1,2-epoxide hydrolase